MTTLEKQIRAVYDEQTITVYQAYSKAIAEPAVRHQKFVPPFKMERMTWIKPSFLWMMYRCGWSSKEGQEHTLAIKIKREGFEWALRNSCLSHFDPMQHSSEEAWKKQLSESPVRIQWDPEKDIFLQNLNYRSIQIGLSGEAVKRYVNDWIVSIEDISQRCREIKVLVDARAMNDLLELIPKERTYEIREELKKIITHS